MTHLELKNKVSVSICIRGHFKITILFRNKLYTKTSTDTMAYDRLDEEDISKHKYYVSSKQAYLSLYSEVKNYYNLK